MEERDRRKRKERNIGERKKLREKGKRKTGRMKNRINKI